MREKVARVVKMPIAQDRGEKRTSNAEGERKRKKEEENLGVNPRPLNLQ